MTTPFCGQLSGEYHLHTRCVRRAFLCGEDAHSGQSYEHRHQWVVDRLGQLSRLFVISICTD
jgi:putative transposase